MSKPDGGTAFPTEIFGWRTEGGLNGDQITGAVRLDGGMSLRDYFAAAALKGMLAKHDDYAPNAVAQRAYQHANAMLSERDK